MISYLELTFHSNYYTSYRYKLIREIHKRKIIKSLRKPHRYAKCRIQSHQILFLMSLIFFLTRIHLQKNSKRVCVVNHISEKNVICTHFMIVIKKHSVLGVVVSPFQNLFSLFKISPFSIILHFLYFVTICT